MDEKPNTQPGRNTYMMRPQSSASLTTPNQPSMSPAQQPASSRIMGGASPQSVNVASSSFQSGQKSEGGIDTPYRSTPSPSGTAAAAGSGGAGAHRPRPHQSTLYTTTGVPSARVRPTESLPPTPGFAETPAKLPDAVHFEGKVLHNNSTPQGGASLWILPAGSAGAPPSPAIFPLPQVYPLQQQGGIATTSSVSRAEPEEVEEVCRACGVPVLLSTTDTQRRQAQWEQHAAQDAHQRCMHARVRAEVAAAAAAAGPSRIPVAAPQIVRGRNGPAAVAAGAKGSTRRRLSKNRHMSPSEGETSESSKCIQADCGDEHRRSPQPRRCSKHHHRNHQQEKDGEDERNRRSEAAAAAQALEKHDEMLLSNYQRERDIRCMRMCLRRWYTVMFLSATANCQSATLYENTRDGSSLAAVSQHLPSASGNALAVPVAAPPTYTKMGRASPLTGVSPAPAASHEAALPQRQEGKVPASSPVSAPCKRCPRCGKRKCLPSLLRTKPDGPQLACSSHIKTYEKVHMNPVASTSSQELEVAQTDVRWYMVPSSENKRQSLSGKTVFGGIQAESEESAGVTNDSAGRKRGHRRGGGRRASTSHAADQHSKGEKRSRRRQGRRGRDARRSASRGRYSDTTGSECSSSRSSSSNTSLGNIRPLSSDTDIEAVVARLSPDTQVRVREALHGGIAKQKGRVPHSAHDDLHVSKDERDRRKSSASSCCRSLSPASAAALPRTAAALDSLSAGAALFPVLPSSTAALSRRNSPCMERPLPFFEDTAPRRRSGAAEALTPVNKDTSSGEVMFDRPFGASSAAGKAMQSPGGILCAARVIASEWASKRKASDSPSNSVDADKPPTYSQVLSEEDDADSQVSAIPLRTGVRSPESADLGTANPTHAQSKDNNASSSLPGVGDKCVGTDSLLRAADGEPHKDESSTSKIAVTPLRPNALPTHAVFDRESSAVVSSPLPAAPAGSRGASRTRQREPVCLPSTAVPALNSPLRQSEERRRSRSERPGDKVEHGHESAVGSKSDRSHRKHCHHRHCEHCGSHGRRTRSRGRSSETPGTDDAATLALGKDEKGNEPVVPFINPEDYRSQSRYSLSRHRDPHTSFQLPLDPRATAVHGDHTTPHRYHPQRQQQQQQPPVRDDDAVFAMYGPALYREPGVPDQNFTGTPGEYYIHEEGRYYRVRDPTSPALDWIPPSMQRSPGRRVQGVASTRVPLYMVRGTRSATPPLSGLYRPSAWKSTRGKSPLGCSRLNPYCEICIARYNLVLVDESMHLLRWPSPRATGISRMADCRYHNGYVYTSPDMGAIPSLVSPPRRTLTPEHSSSVPRATGPTAATGPVSSSIPVSTPRNNDATGRSGRRQQQQQQQVSCSSALEGQTSASDAVGTTGEKTYQWRDSRQPLSDCKLTATSIVASTAGSTEPSTACTGASSKDGSAALLHREERALRHKMKQLLWHELPEQRDTEMWHDYVKLLNEGLELMSHLRAQRQQGATGEKP